MSKQFKALVKNNRQLAKNHYLITLHPSEKITRPRPGQFFMLSVDRGLDPLLRRPFSIHRYLGRDFQLLYRDIGKATGILKTAKPGDNIEAIGPLGNGFPVTEKSPILVAGGLGIAPLLNLAETISSGRKTGHKKEQLFFFFGAKTKKELLCLDELKSIGIKPVISTDDGSLGEKGTVIDALNNFLTSRFSLPASHLLYACGPRPMLKEVSGMALRYGLRGYIALEENMACGVGACLSCVVNTRDGFKRVCKDGPVFPIEEIVW